MGIRRLLAIGASVLAISHAVAAFVVPPTRTINIPASGNDFGRHESIQVPDLTRRSLKSRAIQYTGFNPADLHQRLIVEAALRDAQWLGQMGQQALAANVHSINDLPQAYRDYFEDTPSVGRLDLIRERVGLLANLANENIATTIVREPVQRDGNPNLRASISRDDQVLHLYPAFFNNNYPNLAAYCPFSGQLDDPEALTHYHNRAAAIAHEVWRLRIPGVHKSLTSLPLQVMHYDVNRNDACKPRVNPCQGRAARA
jgi:hypothetical protein